MADRDLLTPPQALRDAFMEWVIATRSFYGVLTESGFVRDGEPKSGIVANAVLNITHGTVAIAMALGGEEAANMRRAIEEVSDIFGKASNGK